MFMVFFGDVTDVGIVLDNSAGRIDRLKLSCCLKFFRKFSADELKVAFGDARAIGEGRSDVDGAVVSGVVIECCCCCECSVR